jgi:outer membrane protein assembly factor BamB
MEFLMHRIFNSLLLCVMLLSIFACTSGRVPVSDKVSAWPYYRKELSAIGTQSTSTFSGKLDIVWEDRVSGKPCGPLSLYGNSLVYPNAKGKLELFRADSGLKTTAVKTSGVPQSGALFVDTLLLVATAPPKNALRAFRVSNGKMLWKKMVKDVSAGSIVVKNNLILSSGDGTVTSFRISDGNSNWVCETEGRITAAPMFQNGTIIQPASNNHIYGISSETGNILFKTKTENPVVSNAVADDAIYCADIQGIVYSINPASGAINWQTETGATIWAAPAVSNGMVYLAASSGAVIALNSQTGTVRWTTAVIDVCKAAPLVVGDVVVVGTMTGRVISLNANTGELIDQRQLIGAISAAPIANEHSVFVATDKGYIHCFGKRNESATANIR